ncbi:MAG TPA: hypothetical protein VKI99_11650 [Candidatus Dormibacteraeota bacterium]|nr:hypothetical protein [Candidatus Dormibacteraeota bacterium]
MLEEVAAAYLILAPLAACLILGVVAAIWFAGSRPATAEILARNLHRPPRTRRR